MTQPRTQDHVHNLSPLEEGEPVVNPADLDKLLAIDKDEDTGSIVDEEGLDTAFAHGNGSDGNETDVEGQNQADKLANPWETPERDGIDAKVKPLTNEYDLVRAHSFWKIINYLKGTDARGELADIHKEGDWFNLLTLPELMGAIVDVCGIVPDELAIQLLQTPLISSSTVCYGSVGQTTYKVLLKDDKLSRIGLETATVTRSPKAYSDIAGPEIDVEWSVLRKRVIKWDINGLFRRLSTKPDTGAIMADDPRIRYLEECTRLLTPGAKGFTIYFSNYLPVGVKHDGQVNPLYVTCSKKGSVNSWVAPAELKGAFPAVWYSTLVRVKR